MIYSFVRNLTGFMMTLNDAYINLIETYGSDDTLRINGIINMMGDYGDIVEICIGKNEDENKLVKFKSEGGDVYDLLEMKVDYAASIYEMVNCGLLLLTYGVRVDLDKDMRKEVYDLFDRSGELAATVESQEIVALISGAGCFRGARRTKPYISAPVDILMHKQENGKYVFCVADHNTDANGKAIFADYLSIYELMSVFDLIWQNRK